MTSQVLQRADEARRGAVHRPIGVLQEVLRGLDDDGGAAHVRAAVGRGVSANYGGVVGRDGLRASLAIGRCAGFGIWLHAGRRAGVVFSSGHVRLRHFSFSVYGRVARVDQ